MALSIGISQFTAAIASGASLSSAIPIGATWLVGVAMPAAWTAASITFQVSVDGGTTWLELVDSTGTAVSLTVAASQYIQIDPNVFCGINHIKVRSGTSGSPVTQGADRSLTLVTRL